jgi:hypothetical protein
LHREDAKDAKKKKDFIAKSSIFPLGFVFLCSLRGASFFNPTTLSDIDRIREIIQV